MEIKRYFFIKKKKKGLAYILMDAAFRNHKLWYSIEILITFMVT